MKKLFRIVCLILTIICFYKITACNLKSCDLIDGLFLKREPAFDYQDFICAYVRDAESFYGTSKENATGVSVITFIEKDKEWDRVVIPNFVNNLPVIAVGNQSGGFSWTSLVGRGYYKKIYIPSSLQNCTPADMFDNETVFFIGYTR